MRRVRLSSKGLLVLAFGRMGDWQALFLIACIAGLYTANEIRDIMICEFLLRQRAAKDTTPAWIRRGLFILSLYRRFGLLPQVAQTIINLIFWNGATAVEIFLNGVAVLFVLEADDAIFSNFIPEGTGAEVEATGRPIIGEDARQMLTTTKRNHVVALTIAIPLSVWIMLFGANADIASAAPTKNVFFLCAAIDAQVDNEPSKTNQVLWATIWVLHLAGIALMEYVENQPPDASLSW